MLFANKSWPGERSEEVKDEVFQHFSEAFIEDDQDRPTPNGISFNRISEDERMQIEAVFMDNEIKETFWSCDGSKSLRPDKFNFFS
ncbi:unnamed protein product [Lathyrus sativus]|nr:unnamed protein product [Lathyrus sativus]